MTLLRLRSDVFCVLLVLSFSCATGGAAPDKPEAQRLEELRTTQANDLHAQLVECRKEPGQFCHACLKNRPAFLDEADQRDWHHICRNVVMSQHCAPGFEDPNLSVQARRAFCEEATLGQSEDAANEEDTGAPTTRTPPEPTQEELARVKQELIKAIQKVDAEDAKGASPGPTSPPPSNPPAARRPK